MAVSGIPVSGIPMSIIGGIHPMLGGLVLALRGVGGVLRMSIGY